MKKLAEDLYLLEGWPPYAINIYLMGDVLLDAGTRFAADRIFRQIAGYTVRAHALTHAHLDHQGSSKAVCEALKIPLWCGEGDADAMETGNWSLICAPRGDFQQSIYNLLCGPPYPVSRRLREGEEVAGFTVYDAPGHTPGQVAFWREKDHVLILGDVLNGMNLTTGAPGLHEPPRAFSRDPALNRASARKLAKLGPELVCFGHGRPWSDAAGFQQFVASLPA